MPEPKLKLCLFCATQFRGRSAYCKKSCRTLYAGGKRFRITEDELVKGSIDYEKSTAAGKPVRSFEAIRQFLIGRGILIPELKK